jgi:hypothetical protein
VAEHIKSALFALHVGETSEETHSLSHTLGRYRLVVLTTSGDLFVYAKDLLIAAMTAIGGAPSRQQQRQPYSKGAFRTDGLIELNSRISCIHSSGIG